jgi:hypothetical protein
MRLLRPDSLLRILVIPGQRLFYLPDLQNAAIDYRASVLSLQDPAVVAETEMPQTTFQGSLPSLSSNLTYI